MDISIKILTLGPLTRSIICHYTLPLVGKPGMTGIILTFPGMQSRGNGTEQCVRVDQHTVMVRARVSTLHTAGQCTAPCHYGWCSQFDYVHRQGSRWLSSWCKSSSHLLTPSLPQPSPPQPGLALQPLADCSGLNLWQEKGARETILDTAVSCSLGAT